MKHAVKSITEQICTPSLKIATYVLAVMLAATAGGSSLVVTDTGATYTPDSGSAVVFSDGKLTQDVEVSSATFESGATLDLNGYNFLLNGALTDMRMSIWKAFCISSMTICCTFSFSSGRTEKLSSS